MFARWKRKRSELDEAIDLVLASMKEFGPENEEFAQFVKYLDGLMKIKAQEEKRRSRIDPNTVLIVAGNILGILAIVAYEQKHVMASRALTFVNKTEPHIN